MVCHSDVIDLFGGFTGLARAIGIEPGRACHWRSRGIPSKYWMLVEDAARVRRIGVTVRDLMRLPARPPRQAKAA